MKDRLCKQAERKGGRAIGCHRYHPTLFRCVRQACENFGDDKDRPVDIAVRARPVSRLPAHPTDQPLVRLPTRPLTHSPTTDHESVSVSPRLPTLGMRQRILPPVCFVSETEVLRELQKEVPGPQRCLGGQLRLADLRCRRRHVNRYLFLVSPLPSPPTLYHSIP